MATTPRATAPLAVLSLSLCAAGAPGAPGEAAVDPELRELSQLDFEDLLSIPVTSVAGVEEDWFTTPAAMYVITGEDARRSGHRTLAETLRLVPGMHVARVASSQWRVEPRGFTGVTVRSNKNLVIIDGRTVWDPIYSGVLWDRHDVVMEDLDRIEVIRGPGATLWGANAVNGVINVVTKSARDTQGLYVTAGAGNFDDAFSDFRYGGQAGDDTWYRVYGTYDAFDSMEVRPFLQATLGETGHDDWSLGRLGFRIDREGADDVTMTLEGETFRSFTYGSRANVPVPGQSLVFDEQIGDSRIAGGHLLARIGHSAADPSGWSLQAYYDRNENDYQALKFNRDAGDVEFRHWTDWGERQALIWGLRGSYWADETEPAPSFVFTPESEEFYTFSTFVQNTTELVPDKLHATLGSKLEYNSFTQVEVQPSARLAWTPNDRHTVWGAVSRAVRVPSRLERDALFVSGFIDEGVLGGGAPTGVIIPLGVTGDDSLESEELLAYELGHRVRLGESVTLDNALFFHDYDQLIYVSSTDPGPVQRFTNAGEGESYGLESVVTWRVADNWRLEATYSYVNVHHDGAVTQFEDDNTPHHQASLRSYLDITEDVELNTLLYYVDELPSAAEEDRLRLDIGTTWRVTDHLELAVWGQNLLDPEHSEASAFEVPRTFYVQATLRF